MTTTLFLLLMLLVIMDHDRIPSTRSHRDGGCALA